MEAFMKVQSTLAAVLPVGVIGNKPLNGKTQSCTEIINLCVKLAFKKVCTNNSKVKRPAGKISNTELLMTKTQDSESYKKEQQDKYQKEYDDCYLDIKKKKTKVTDLKMIDGSVYTGEGYEITYQKTIILFIPDGKGSSIMPNGDIVLGRWVDGVVNSMVYYQ